MIPTKNNLCPQTQGKDCCTGATSATHHRHMSPYMVSSHSRENRHHPLKRKRRKSVQHFWVQNIQSLHCSMRVTWRMRFSETPDAYKELSRAVYLRTSTIAGEQMLIFASPTQANTGTRQVRGKEERKK